MRAQCSSPSSLGPRSDPLTALIVATVFIASVIVLHIVSKFAR